MAYPNSFKNCKVFIHSLTNKNVSHDSVILEHDKQRIVITIKGSLSMFAENDKVSLLIIDKSAIYEFKGTVRKEESSETREIALFSGKEKESREAARYAVNLSAKVEGLIIGKGILPINPPAYVQILNISSTGMLIQTSANIFNLETNFRIRINMGSSESIFLAKVMRVHSINGTLTEYGCIFTGRV